MAGTNISAPNENWRTYENAAKRGTILTNFAYDQQKGEEVKELADKIPEGFELLLMTDHVDDTKEASFRCAAFVNNETKEIVFATAGTRPVADKRGLDDAYDDIMLVAQKKPSKMNPAEILNDMVLDSLGPEAKDYKFSYTGHSLGAAMAEMQAVDMDIKLTKKGLKQPDQISAVTFENPGTKPILEKMYEKAGLPKNSFEKLDLCEFNNRKNIINDLNPQAGKTFTIIPHSQKERNPNAMQMVFEYISKKVSKLSPFIAKAFDLMAPGGLGTSLVSDHSLTNFDEVFVQGKGNIKDKAGNIMPLEQAYSGIQPLEYDKEIASKLKEMKQDKGDVGKTEFVMNKFDKDTGKTERITFSKIELDAVIRTVEIKPAQKPKSMVERIQQEKSAKQVDSPAMKLNNAKDAVGQAIRR